MDAEKAIKFIKEDGAREFAVLPINDKTFKQIGFIRKYGTYKQFTLAEEGLADVLQADFNQLQNAEDNNNLSSVAYQIYCESRKVLNPLVDAVNPKFTNEDYVNGWNMFIRGTDIERIRIKKGIGAIEWALNMTILVNDYESIRKICGGDFSGFIQKSIGAKSQYFFCDRWFVSIDGIPYSNNTPTDMINTLLNNYLHDDKICKTIFDAYDEWMIAHKDEVKNLREGK